MQSEQMRKTEQALSRLGALVSQAVEDVSESVRATQRAEQKLTQIQSEIEQLYITLDEPILTVWRQPETAEITKER